MLDALDPPYVQRALVAALALAIPLGVLGCWVTLRGLAFYAHAVGVATFPGVVIGLALPVLGPFAGALLAAFGFSAVVSTADADHRLRGGAATGLALAVALAAGAVLLTALGAGAAPVDRLLFGSLLAVSAVDVARCVAAGIVSLVALGFLLPRLAATTFDPDWAVPVGAGERLTTGALLVLVSAVVVCALPAVGSLLVSALLVVPAATARLLTDRLGPLLGWAIGLCALDLVAGLLVARYLDLPPGAAVAATGGGVFAVAAVAGAVAGRLGPIGTA
jgi:ABC-type Mn2+/Zn2+ transport system permease subunit